MKGFLIAELTNNSREVRAMFILFLYNHINVEMRKKQLPA